MQVRRDFVTKAFDGDKKCDTLVVPHVLTSYILDHAHDALGHNDTLHVYHFIRFLHYWKGSHKDVDRHCLRCAQENLTPLKCASLLLTVLHVPMLYITMDLTGRFQNTSTESRYAFTIIWLLIGYVWCFYLCTKEVDEVVQTDIKYATFVGSLKMLSDNSSRFKKTLSQKSTKQ